MDWQTPVWQRTAAMVAAHHPDCYLTPQLLNRIEGNTQWLAAAMNAALPPARRWTAADCLTPAQMQRQLEGLAALRAVWYPQGGGPPLPPCPATDHETFNQMEGLQAQLHTLCLRHAQRLRSYAGECYAGEMGGIL